MTPKFGAVVEGVDAKAPLSEDTVWFLKGQLMEYKVLFFRDQNLDYGEHQRFAAQFGSPRVDPLETSVDEYPGMGLLDNVPFFHSDWMFQEDPPSWSVLQMTTVPEVGGDTMFVDLAQSYSDLSEPLQKFLEGLTVWQATSSEHAADRKRQFIARTGDESSAEFDLLLKKLEPRAQPLVRLIPETGGKNYWICEAYSRYIVELNRGESDLLLGWLFRHIYSPQYVVRWKWEAGDLAFWDHRTTLHRGVKDYGTAPRAGRRMSVAANRVIPAKSPSG